MLAENSTRAIRTRKADLREVPLLAGSGCTRTAACRQGVWRRKDPQSTQSGHRIGQSRCPKTAAQDLAPMSMKQPDADWRTDTNALARGSRSLARSRAARRGDPGPRSLVKSLHPRAAAPLAVSQGRAP